MKNIIDSLFQRTIFFVEANAFEQSILCEDYGFKYLEPQAKITVAEGHWFFRQEVVVLFTFAEYHGQVICFFEVVSNWSDKEKIEDWIVKNYNPTFRNGTQIAITDACYFTDVIDAVKEKLPPVPKNSEQKKEDSQKVVSKKEEIKRPKLNLVKN